jgi:allantoinase
MQMIWPLHAVCIDGVELHGRVKSTFLRGELVYNDGNVTGPARGKYLRRPEAARKK